jgi:starvation-inducible DNA-binding protein
VRALDAYALGGLATMAKAAGLEEFSAPRSQEDYVRALVAANQKVAADAAVARDVAEAARDTETQDLMIERVALHQKTIWMLKSFLKS